MGKVDQNWLKTDLRYNRYYYGLISRVVDRPRANTSAERFVFHYRLYEYTKPWKYDRTLTEFKSDVFANQNYHHFPSKKKKLDDWLFPTQILLLIFVEKDIKK